MRQRSPPPGASRGCADDDADGGWLSWLGLDGDAGRWPVGVAVAALLVSCAVMANRPSQCTVQEGLCSTTTCSCADPAHQLRELRTPEGLQCWQCVAMCPAQIGGNVSDACYAGNCECADPTQERVTTEASTQDMPCYKCISPPPVVLLRAGLEPERSCLVRAPRSRLPPRPAANGTSSGNMTTGLVEPMLRLVLAEGGAELNASCAPFVREGSALRERNTSLCLSWSSSGGVWGLAKCAAPGAPEAQLQAFRDRPAPGDDEGPAAAFCTAGAGGRDEACVGLRGHVCTAEANVCTPRPCECEDATWIKHEAPLLDSGAPCWSCAPPVVPYCSVQPGVCTTTACECEDPSHEKIRSNTTEPPLRACWSCRPQGGYRSVRGSGASSAVGALVGVFLFGLLGGLVLRHWGEEPLPALAPQRGKKVSKAAVAMLRPLPWSERLALELEDIWATLEDGAALVGQLCAVATKPMRRWRKQAAGAAAPYLKGFSEKASGAAARVTDAASGASGKIVGIINSARNLVPTRDASTPPAASGASGSTRSRKTQQLPPQSKEVTASAGCPAVAGDAAPAVLPPPAVAAEAALPRTPTPLAEAPTAPFTALEPPALTPAPAAEGTKEEATRKRRRPKKRGSGEAPAATEGSPAAVVEADAEDDAVGEDAVPTLQTAAVDSGEPLVDEEGQVVANVGLNAEAAIVVAEPPVMTAVPPSLEATESPALVQSAEPPKEPKEAAAVAAALSGPPGEKGRGDCQEWDPLATAARHAGDLQHARMLMLLSNTRNSGLKVDKRSLAANWLLIYYITPAERGAEAEAAKNQEAGAPEADEDAATPSRRRRKKRGKRGAGGAEAEAEAKEEVSLTPAGMDVRAWDPMGPSPAAEGSGLQHARLLLLLSGARRAGTPYSTRTLAATWLMFFYMPESCRQLPKHQQHLKGPKTAQSQEADEGAEDEGDGDYPVAVVTPVKGAEVKRRRSGRGRSGVGAGTVPEGWQGRRQRR